ncbi:MAG: RluA family pseudouridine synthase [Planctomycetota bacterium]
MLFADEHLLVVDKPAGLVSVAGRPGEPALPEVMVQRRLVAPDEPFRVVQRLDRDASGVLVYARTLDAQRNLTEQFATQQIEKVYLALVQGYVPEDGVVELPLATDKSGSRATIAPRNGKPAVTEYHIRERVAGHTLLECRPRTGRFHQIRAHLAAIGHPLAVDPLYGGGTAVRLSEYKPDYRASRRHEERPLIDRLTLHAARLTLAHPAGGARLSFEAPLPKDLRATLHQLRRLPPA